MMAAVACRKTFSGGGSVATEFTDRLLNVSVLLTSDDQLLTALTAIQASFYRQAIELPTVFGKTRKCDTQVPPTSARPWMADLSENDM